MKRTKIFVIIPFLSVLTLASTVSAAEQSFIEAKVCDWHIYSHIAIAEADSTLRHSYPSHYPPDGPRIIAIVKKVGIAAAIGFVASSAKFGVARTVKWTLLGLLVTATGALGVTIEARLEEDTNYHNYNPDWCRVVRREVTVEQAQKALAYVEQQKQNPRFNIFYETCADFSSRLFHEAGQDVPLLEEASKVKPLNDAYFTGFWLNWVRRYVNSI
jgi:hypothetical protein